MVCQRPGGARKGVLVECPQHLIPAVIAKNDGIRPSFRRSERDSDVEDIPLEYAARPRHPDGLGHGVRRLRGGGAIFDNDIAGHQS